MHIRARFNTRRVVFCAMTSGIVALSFRILRMSSWTLSTGFPLYMSGFICPHRKKSISVKFGDRGGQAIRLHLPVHLSDHSRSTYARTIKQKWSSSPCCWKVRRSRSTGGRWLIRSGRSFFRKSRWGSPSRRLGRIMGPIKSELINHFCK